jgi:hypothetical protein
VPGVLFYPGCRDARYQPAAILGVAIGTMDLVVGRGATQSLEDGAAFLALVFVDGHSEVFSIAGI